MGHQRICITVEHSISQEEGRRTSVAFNTAPNILYTEGSDDPSKCVRLCATFKMQDALNRVNSWNHLVDVVFK